MKATELLRASVSQEWREILGQSEGLRKVTICVPSSPAVAFFFATDEEGKRSPEDLGLNRTYKGAELPGGHSVGPINILPYQRIFAASVSGVAGVALIVEDAT